MGGTLKVLGVDPGATTGLAIFDTEQGRFCFVDEKKLIRTQGNKYIIFGSELMEWVQLMADEIRTEYRSFDAIACENFIQRPYRAELRSGKTTNALKFDQDLWVIQYTAKLVGVFTALATILDIPYVEQEPSIKPVGYGILGNRYVPGKPGTHILDAMAHAAFYCHRRGIIWKGKHDSKHTS